MSEPIVETSDLDAYLLGDKQVALDAATAAVRAYCGWHVTPVSTETVTVGASSSRGDFDPHLGRFRAAPTVILLPSLRITSVDSVTVDGEEVGFDWSEHGVLRSPVTTCSDVTVTFTHGYESVPEVAAIILAVAARAIASPSGVVRTQVGQISETYSQSGFNQAGGLSLLDSEKAILDRHKLPPRP